METDNLFRGSGYVTLEKNAAITNFRGICLDVLEGIFLWDSQTRECLDIYFDFLDNCCMGWSPRRWIGLKPIKKRFSLISEILIEIGNAIKRS